MVISKDLIAFKKSLVMSNNAYAEQAPRMIRWSNFMTPISIHYLTVSTWNESSLTKVGSPFKGCTIFKKVKKKKVVLKNDPQKWRSLSGNYNKKRNTWSLESPMAISSKTTVSPIFGILNSFCSGLVWRRRWATDEIGRTTEKKNKSI